MKTLRYRSKGSEVYMLGEILVELGYTLDISNYFGKEVHNAIMDFQKKNGLVIDGIVGSKTWSKLIEAQNTLTVFNDKFLSENDLQDFANQYHLELAAVKAVNEIESLGKGFLIDGRPRILFEGHIFWKELKKRGINPEDFVSENTKNVLYKNWTKQYYEGGKQEYDRLEKAAGMSDLDAVHEAAFASASYGAFQIMGFNYAIVGFPSVDSFVSQMYTHEKAQLADFGKFCESNNLIRHLQSKNWALFAKGYNGTAYKQNKYDTKLENAYNKYKAWN